MFFFFSTSILNRCVPVVIKKFTVGLLNNFIKVLNRWDLVEEILGDVYNAWPTILGFTVFALGDYFLFQILFCFVRLIGPNFSIF